jgi:hypothetical protein
MDDVIAAKPEMSPKKAALLWSAFLLVAFVLLLAMQGGHPYSNWFYVVMAVAFGAIIYGTLNGKAKRTLLANPPFEVRVALRSASLQTLYTAVGYLAVASTLTGEVRQPIWTAILAAPLIGAHSYLVLRGKKTSSRILLAILVAFLLVMTASVLLITSRH